MTTASTDSRSTRLLLESGALSADPVSRLVGANDLVLSRALCRFRLYRAPPNLNRRQFALAARAFAEAHAPFADTDMLLLRSGTDVAIWYWDRAKLAPHAPVRQASPESVWRTPGDGWAIVACVEGYEAQYWEAGSLVASTWRRQPFAAAQWAAFTLSVDQPTRPAPAEPPTPAGAAMDDAGWRGRMIKEPLGWRDAERISVTVAICALTVAALFTGQALRSERIASDETARAEAIEHSLREDRNVARAREQLRLLRDYQAVANGAPALLAAAEAHEVLSRFGLRASTWRAGAEGVSFIVDAPISEAPVRDLVAAMEQSPHLCAAVPEVAGAGRFEIRASVAATDAECGAGEGGPA